MVQRTATLLPTDPLFGVQWHLNNTGQIADAVAGQDINVIGVWPDYTGQGIVVAVFDDGFDQTHPDLIANYRADLSWDFILDIPGAQQGASDDGHGTAVAGLIGASANNQVGGVGVAWNATLIGYRQPDAVVEAFSKAVIRMLDVGADISSNSWGTGGAFAFAVQSGQPSLVESALSLATNGREGLGTVVLFSAGNNRAKGVNNTNYDPSKNIPYAIVVAAGKADGLITSYSTPGASVLVTAPGSDPDSIVTTDWQGADGYNKLPGEAGNYTDVEDTFFDGTSASAPIAAGVVALMLEANARLGYRDIQEILVYSSKRAVFLDATGVQSDVNQAVDWNGGGLLTGYDFGFGNIDAQAAVRLAESWSAPAGTIANWQSARGVSTSPAAAIIDNNPQVVFLDIAYVNDASVIRKNPKVVAINSAVEIDITGQVCADSIGTYQYSGVGGQMDFMRGAALSDKGKPIIVMKSVTKEGHSKIVPFLKDGAGVVTTRAHVHYVVTEFGVAYLFGKNLLQRAIAMRDIAHPNHREWLDKEIFNRFLK